jgi:hypothetical protein
MIVFARGSIADREALAPAIQLFMAQRIHAHSKRPLKGAPDVN